MKRRATSGTGRRKCSKGGPKGGRPVVEGSLAGGVEVHFDAPFDTGIENPSVGGEWAQWEDGVYYAIKNTIFAGGNKQ